MKIKTKKIVARIFLGLFAFIALGLLVRGVLNYTTGKHLESTIKKMKAEGIRLSVQDFEPTCKDTDNAGLIWRGIETMFVKDFNSPEITHFPMKKICEGKTLDLGTQDRIAEAASRHQLLFYLIRESANKPCFKYARRWKEVAFGLSYINLQKLAPLLRLFLLNVYVQAERGEREQALQDCRAALQNISFFLHEPHPFNRFMSVSLAVEHLAVLRAVLQEKFQDEKTYQSIMEILSRFHVPESLRYSLELERAMTLEEYMSLLSGQKKGLWHEKALLWLFKPLIKSETVFYLHLWQDAVHAMGEPYYGDRKRLNLYLERTEKIPRRYRLARIFYSPLPWFQKEYTRLEAVISVVQTALVCRMYFLHHGFFPEALDPLFPEGQKITMIDPFTGRPLMYLQKPKGFIVYSLGPNQKDDGGRGSWGWALDGGDDIAWEE